eukprot:TRINITY_DN11436_c0_g1_i1.p1 TRINITY_DN11436_c0_g1~~TRINITY_DN11436_c0_g1_i1.p1  ORF type:complete len:1118 (-),score=217.53 TRINITY_DN11436_c0_g1_i1:66-3419(-)
MAETEDLESLATVWSRLVSISSVPFPPLHEVSSNLADPIKVMQIALDLQITALDLTQDDTISAVQMLFMMSLYGGIKADADVAQLIAKIGKFHLDAGISLFSFIGTFFRQFEIPPGLRFTFEDQFSEFMDKQELPSPKTPTGDHVSDVMLEALHEDLRKFAESGDPASIEAESFFEQVYDSGALVQMLSSKRDQFNAGSRCHLALVRAVLTRVAGTVNGRAFATYLSKILNIPDLSTSILDLVGIFVNEAFFLRPEELGVLIQRVDVPTHLMHILRMVAWDEFEPKDSLNLLHMAVLQAAASFDPEGIQSILNFRKTVNMLGKNFWNAIWKHSMSLLDQIISSATLSTLEAAQQLLDTIKIDITSIIFPCLEKIKETDAAEAKMVLVIGQMIPIARNRAKVPLSKEKLALIASHIPLIGVSSCVHLSQILFAKNHSAIALVLEAIALRGDWPSTVAPEVIKSFQFAQAADATVSEKFGSWLQRGNVGAVGIAILYATCVPEQYESYLRACVGAINSCVPNPGHKLNLLNTMVASLSCHALIQRPKILMAEIFAAALDAAATATPEDEKVFGDIVNTLIPAFDGLVFDISAIKSSLIALGGRRSESPTALALLNALRFTFAGDQAATLESWVEDVVRDALTYMTGLQTNHHLSDGNAKTAIDLLRSGLLPFNARAVLQVDVSPLVELAMRLRDPRIQRALLDLIFDCRHAFPKKYFETLAGSTALWACVACVPVLIKIQALITANVVDVEQHLLKFSKYNILTPCISSLVSSFPSTSCSTVSSLSSSVSVALNLLESRVDEPEALDLLIEWLSSLLSTAVHNPQIAAGVCSGMRKAFDRVSGFLPHARQVSTFRYHFAKVLSYYIVLDTMRSGQSIGKSDWWIFKILQAAFGEVELTIDSELFFELMKLCTKRITKHSLDRISNYLYAALADPGPPSGDAPPDGNDDATGDDGDASFGDDDAGGDDGAVDLKDAGYDGVGNEGDSDGVGDGDGDAYGDDYGDDFSDEYGDEVEGDEDIDEDSDEIPAQKVPSKPTHDTKAVKGAKESISEPSHGQHTVPTVVRSSAAPHRPNQNAPAAPVASPSAQVTSNSTAAADSTGSKPPTGNDRAHDADAMDCD